MGWVLVTRLVTGLATMARELALLPHYAEEAERLHREVRWAAFDEGKAGQTKAQSYLGGASVRPRRP